MILMNEIDADGGREEKKVSDVRIQRYFPKLFIIKCIVLHFPRCVEVIRYERIDVN